MQFLQDQSHSPFNVFVNDLGTRLRSVLMKSADDMKLRSVVNTEGNWNIIQEELYDLGDWRNRNGMKFNSTMYGVMHLAEILVINF